MQREWCGLKVISDIQYLPTEKNKHTPVLYTYLVVNVDVSSEILLFLLHVLMKHD